MCLSVGILHTHYQDYITVQYMISVGTEQYELISTNYTFCPLNLTNKEYLFEVKSSNGAGDGFSSNINVSFQPGIIRENT